MVKIKIPPASKEENDKYIKNILSNKNKGIIYKLEWNSSVKYNFINPITGFYNKQMSFKK
jgi:hypothetical protein